MAVAVKWLNLFGMELVVGAGLGLLWGVGLATVYRWNRKRKADRRHLVSCRAAGRGGGVLVAGWEAGAGTQAQS